MLLFASRINLKFWGEGTTRVIMADSARGSASVAKRVTCSDRDPHICKGRRLDSPRAGRGHIITSAGVDWGQWVGWSRRLKIQYLKLGRDLVEICLCNYCRSFDNPLFSLIAPEL